MRVPLVRPVALLALVVAFPRSSPAAASAPAGDEAALRLLAEELVSAYVRKDLEAYLRLFSPRSPDLEPRDRLKRLFAERPPLVVRSSDVTVVATGDEATLRVRAEVEPEATAGQATTPAPKTLRRVVQCVREEGAWRVWRERAAEEELAARLAAAAATGERERILASQPELHTVGLRKALVDEGERLRLAGSAPLALELYGLAQGLAERIGDRAGVASALRAAGNLHHSRGDHRQALPAFERALAIAESMQDPLAIGIALIGIANVHKQQGRYDTALEHYRRSLELSEAGGDKRAMAVVLNNIGGIHIARGDYDAALDSVRRSLTLREEVGDKLGIAFSHDLLGSIYTSLGDYPRSEDHYRRSQSLREALGDKPGLAVVIGNLGVLYQRQGDYARAFECQQRALALRTELGEKPRVAAAVHNLATLYMNQGNYPQAREHFQRALALRRELGDRRGTASTLYGLASLLAEEGQGTQALEVHREALALREALGDKEGIAASLLDVADLRDKRGDLEGALADARRSLTLSEASGDRRGHALGLHHLARIQLGNGQPEPALAQGQAAVEIARALNDPPILSRALTLEARAHRALGRTDQARRSLEEAVSVIEDWRHRVAGGEQERQRFFENKLEPYRALVDLLLASGRTGDALAYAERAKARALLDTLQSGHLRVSRVLTPAEREDERRLEASLVSVGEQLRQERSREEPDQARLQSLSTRLDKLRLEREALRMRLYAAHPELRAQRVDARPISIDEAAELIPDARTALVEYLVGEEKTHLFVLARDASGPVVKAYTLAVPAKELSRRTRAFRERLAGRRLDFAEDATGLHELLLRPAREQLQGKSRLVVVPDGPLWELPFQALAPSVGRYLIEQATISYAPSLTVLREMQRKRDRPDSAPSLLAFANPTLGQTATERAEVLMGDRLEPLPESERQATGLIKLYGERSRVYVGPQAREDRVKAEAGAFRILHFATHGILNDASPMYSQLVLAKPPDGDQEDGLLEAREILDLDLKADLAVLSACETARGRMAPGEGVIGLSWAFFVAGCPTTVVSQWKVESRSTTELMLAFHRGLRAGKPKAEALRAAALKLLSVPRWRHPFYWAPFVLMGAAS